MVDRDILARRIVLLAAILFVVALVFSGVIILFAPWTESVKWVASLVLWPVVAVVVLLAAYLWNPRRSWPHA